MRFIRLTSTTLPLALAALIVTSGCKSNTQPPPQQAQQPAPNQAAQEAVNPESNPAPASSGSVNHPPQQGQGPAAQPAYAPPPKPLAPTVIPRGTHIVVSLGQTISSKTAQAGDTFSATVAEPVVVRGATLIRAGAPATGTVTDARALGHFKGAAELAIRLDSVQAEGRRYEVASSTIDRTEKGKGKRTAALTGGGAGLGGLIGGLAGGGKGVLIGGLAGAGAGGAGSAFTGNKELVIPAETSVTFRLERDVPLR